MSLPTAKVQETPEAKTNYLVTYPAYHIKPINLPSRSSLYNLEPQGIGTPYVESLTSYIQRLAAAHCVATGTLISKTFGAVLERNSKDIAMVCSNTAGRSLNGMGKMSLDTLKALKVLTLRNDLHYLTLQPFAEVIHTRNLYRPIKAWCPICLEEWRTVGQEIYEPLIWSIQIVRTCLRHLHPLHECCHHCGKSYVPIAWYSRPGFCSKCYRWLGVNNSAGLLKTLESEELINIRHAELICDLLANSKNLESLLSRETLSRSLLKCIEQFAQNNTTEFARRVNKGRDLIKLWCLGKKLPTLESILHICSCFDLSLTDFFTITFVDRTAEQVLKEQHSENDLSSLVFTSINCDKEIHLSDAKSTSAEPNQNNIKNNDASSSRKRPSWKVTEEELKIIKNTLEELLSKKELKSLETIAEELKISRKTLSKYFPDLCNQITASFTAEKSEARINKIRLEFEKIISQEFYPPGLKQVATILKTSTHILRNRLPDLCDQLKERRAEYRRSIIESNVIQARNLLEKVLQENKDSPPSLEEIAERYGYHPQTLYKYAHDLCKEVSSRYLAHRKKVREMKIKQICDEVRDITVKLYSQSIYPNIGQVQKLLSIPGYLREEEVVATWKATLKELYGSETEKEAFFSDI